MLFGMNRYLSRFFLLAVCACLAACGTLRSSVVFQPAPGAPGAAAGRSMPARTPIPGGSYRVAKGDTLYSIAFRNGVDFRDLAQWNKVAAPYTIWPGQRLRLSPPKTLAQAPAPARAPAQPGTKVASAGVPSAPVFEPVKRPPGSGLASTTAPAVAASAPTSAPSHAPAVVPVAGKPIPPPVAPPPASPPVPAGGSRSIGGVSWRWPASGNIIKGFKSSDAIPGIEIAGTTGDPVRAAADGVVVYSGNGLVGYGELVIIKHNDSFLSAYGHNSKRLVKEGQRVSAGQTVAEMGSTGASRTELEFQIRKNGNPVDPLGYLPPH